MKSSCFLGKTPILAYRYRVAVQKRTFQCFHSTIEVIEPSSPLFVGVVDLDMHGISFSRSQHHVER